MTLLQPVKHPGHDVDGQNNGPETAYEDELGFTVNVKVTDADGSVGTTSFQVTVDDDTPTMGTITNGSIATNETNSISGTISTNFGADGAQAVPYKFTGTQSVGNGLTEALSSDGTLLTVSSGSTAVYTVQLNANGTYDFNMLNALPRTTQAITAVTSAMFTDTAAATQLDFPASGVKFVADGANLDPYRMPASAWSVV
ncbi:MAG: hypothetical protein MZV49_12370 [Rhodopseudomonas palustris]|nr:hypothetical protein [Rhodopseudomonas palustris]